MSTRIAVVAPSHGAGWDEGHLVVRRLCGALACEADVELLVAEQAPGDEGDADGHDGAVRVRRYGAGARPADPRRRLAVRRALFGPEPADDPLTCGCVAAARRRRAGRLAPGAQDQLLDAEGSRSAALERQLGDGGYDAVVLAGISGTTAGAMTAIAGRLPCVVVPMARDDEILWAPFAAALLGRADRVVVTTSQEAALVRRRLPELAPAAVVDVGFVVRPHEMALSGAPLWADGRPCLVLARDWGRSPLPPRLHRTLDALRRHLGPTVAIRAVGPGVMRLPRGVRVDYATSRTDAWRWMAHAVAVVDPEPGRVIGREVLESMMLGTPVVVAAEGGATRGHAEAGGGLWYRSDDELFACAEALLEDGALCSTLGAQGQRYASGTYGNPDAFVRRVNDVVLGSAA